MVNMSKPTEINNNEVISWNRPKNRSAIFMPSLSRLSKKSNWTQSSIRSLIKQGNLNALEEIVIQGYGDRLIGEVSGIPLIEDFLERIPDLLEQIDQLHKLSVRGDVDSFRLLLDRKDLILSRDRLGATPLHKAVIYGHQQLVEFIASNYPNAFDSCDHDGRTPLHFAAVLADERSIYNILVKQGASTSITDTRGNTPEFYLKNPGQINLKQIIKRSQRLNANYTINTQNRIHSKSPSRRKGRLSPTSSRRLVDSGFGHYLNQNLSHRSNPQFQQEFFSDSEDFSGDKLLFDTRSSTESSSTSSNLLNKSSFGNRYNINGSNIENSNNNSFFRVKRSEVTSATVRRWLEEENFQALEQAAFEGFADKIRIKASIYSDFNNIDIKRHSALRRRISQSAFGLDRETGAGDDFKLESIGRAVARTSGGGHEGLKVYVRETLPKISSRIKAIHAAVSCGDISCLENQLHDDEDEDEGEDVGNPNHHRKSRKDYILAKDHLGMAPLHKAVILGHLDVVQFMLEKFPETINAKDHDGRTALHYAAATTNKNGNIIYKMLLRSGADPRIRDVNGKTADYYRIHLLPLPSEISQLARSVHDQQKRRGRSLEESLSQGKKSFPSSSNVTGPNGYFLSPIKSRRKMTLMLPTMNEKITSAIYSDNVELLNQLILDGYGEYMIGRISFSDETRKLLKKVPSKMESIKRLHAAVPVGDLHTIVKELSAHPEHIRSMDENGLMIIHSAVLYDQLDLIDYLIREFSITLSLKDHFGRTALHVAAQNKSTEIYGKLIEAGADLRTYDARGKTPENYMRFHEITQQNIQRYNKMLSRSCHDVGSNFHETDFESTSNEAGTTTNTSSILTPPTPPVLTKRETIENEETVIGRESETEFDAQTEVESEIEIEPERVDVGSTNQDDAKMLPPENIDFDEAKGHTDELEIKEGEEGVEEEKDGGEVKAEEPPEINEISVDENENVPEGNIIKSEQEDLEAEKSKIMEKLVTTEIDKPRSEIRAKKSDPKRANTFVRKSNIPTKVESQKSKDESEKTKVITQKAIVRRKPIEAKPPSETKKVTVAKKPVEVKKPVAVKKEESKKKDMKPRVKRNVGGAKVVKPVQRKMEEVTKNETEKVTESSVEDSKVEEELTEETVADTKKKDVTFGTDAGVCEEIRRRSSVLVNGATIEDVAAKIVASISEEALNVISQPSSKKTSISSDDHETGEKADETGLELDDPNHVPSNGPQEEQDPAKNDAVNCEINSCEGTNSPSKENQVEDEDAAQLDNTNTISGDPLESPSKLQVDPSCDPEFVEKEKETEEEEKIQLEKEGNEEQSKEVDINHSEDKEEETSNDQNETRTNCDEEEGGLEGRKEEQCEDSEEKEEQAVEIEEKEAEVTKEIVDNDEQTGADDDVVVVETKSGKELEEMETECNKVSGEQCENSSRQENTDVIKDQSSASMVEEEDQQPEKESEVSVVEENAKKDETHSISDKSSVQSQDEETKSVTSSKVEADAITDVVSKRKDSMKSVSSSQAGGSSRPKSSSSSRSKVSRRSSDEKIEKIVDDSISKGDIMKLEHIVIAGQGSHLLGKTSDDKRVQDFLDLVPTYMAKLKSIHDIVVRGNFNEVRKVLTRKRFALSRDYIGASPLHLSVLHDHLDVMIYIITKFPETIDGPDNDGRTALHYAAVVGSGASNEKTAYEILSKAGANQGIKDRAGHEALYYLNHPGTLTVRELLERYKEVREREVSGRGNRKSSVTSTEGRKGSNGSVVTIPAEIWQRPATADIESRLTPPSPDHESNSSKEITVEPEKGIEQESRPKSSKSGKQSAKSRPSSSASSATGVESNKVQVVSADIHAVDEKGSSRPTSAASNITIMSGEEVRQEVESLSINFKETLKVEKEKLRGKNKEMMDENKTKHIPDALSDTEGMTDNEDENPLISIPVPPQLACGEGGKGMMYELCQEKDELGQTILHLAAATPHKPSTLMKLLVSASHLVPERDAKYLTIRGVAIENNQRDNVKVIDKFVINEFIKENVDFVNRLFQGGYDISNVVDEQGYDIMAVLSRNNLFGMVKVLEELAYFTKARDELHTFVKNDYMDGIQEIIKSKPTLVTAKNKRGKCSLHLAVLFGNISLIKLLIDTNPKSVHSLDNLGRTPLHYAMATAQVEEIGKLLVEAGAFRQIRDVKMRTPSYYFVYSDDIRDIKREEQELN